MTSTMPKENAEGHLVWNPSVGLYHQPARNDRESYAGIVGALEDHIAQQSTSGVSKSYPHNFAGIIAAIQDLNVAANEEPVTPDVKPDTGGEIIIKPDGTPEWIDGTDPVDGELWFDTRQGRLFVAVDKQWWQTNGADGIAYVTSDATAPDASPVTGQFWWDGGHETLYIFDGQWIDADGNIEGSNDGNSTPIWRVVNSDPNASMQTTMTLPLGAMGARLANYGIHPDGILPDLDPDDYDVQAHYNEYLWEALLALEQHSLNLSAVIVSEAPPAEPKSGDLWYDTTMLDMSVWYEDEDSAQWVPITSPFNYDADLDVVRSMIVDETRKREIELHSIRQQLADFDAADNTQLLQLARDIETLGNRITVEAADLTPYATTASVQALETELKAAMATTMAVPDIDLSGYALNADIQASLTELRNTIAAKANTTSLNVLQNSIPSLTGLATESFVQETFDNITTTFLPRGGGNLTGSFTMVKEDYALPVFDFSTESWNSKQAFKFKSDAGSTATTTFGTTEDPWEMAWEFGADEDFCWIYNNSKVFSVSKEGPACSTLLLGDFSTNDQYGRSIRNKIDLKERLTTYQFALESIRQGVANATDFDSLKANILSALIDV